MCEKTTQGHEYREVGPLRAILRAGDHMPLDSSVSLSSLRQTSSPTHVYICKQYAEQAWVIAQSKHNFSGSDWRGRITGGPGRVGWSRLHFDKGLRLQEAGGAEATGREASLLPGKVGRSKPCLNI